MKPPAPALNTTKPPRCGFRANTEPATKSVALGSGKIAAIARCIPLARARALLNRLAHAHRPAPFGEADAARRQPEFAELLQRAHLLEPGIKRNIRQRESIAEHIRSPSGAPCHQLVLDEPH